MKKKMGKNLTVVLGGIVAITLIVGALILSNKVVARGNQGWGFIPREIALSNQGWG